MCLSFLLRCGTTVNLSHSAFAYVSFLLVLPWWTGCVVLLSFSCMCFSCCGCTSTPMFAKLKFASRTMFHETSMPCANTRCAYILNKIDYEHGIYNAASVLVNKSFSLFDFHYLSAFRLVCGVAFAYCMYILARSSPITKASSDYTPKR